MLYNINTITGINASLTANISFHNSIKIVNRDKSSSLFLKFSNSKPRFETWEGKSRWIGLLPHETLIIKSKVSKSSALFCYSFDSSKKTFSITLLFIMTHNCIIFLYLYENLLVI